MFETNTVSKPVQCFVFRGIVGLVEYVKLYPVFCNIISKEDIHTSNHSTTFLFVRQGKNETVSNGNENQIAPPNQRWGMYLCWAPNAPGYTRVPALVRHQFSSGHQFSAVNIDSSNNSCAVLSQPAERAAVGACCRCAFLHHARLFVVNEPRCRQFCAFPPYVLISHPNNIIPCAQETSFANLLSTRDHQDTASSTLPRGKKRGELGRAWP